MDVLLLARLQFAITIIYHFFFVPLTLGLSLVVAILETIYVITGKETYKRTDQVLGKVIPDQFCRWCGHRHRPGISVWYGMVGILALCWGYFRSSISDRSIGCIFPGIHFFGCVDFWVG